MPSHSALHQEQHKAIKLFSLLDFGSKRFVCMDTFNIDLTNYGQFKVQN
jgi:hypothetical protein